MEGDPIQEIEGERIILDVDYLLADIVTGLTREITGDSIYQYLEQELHLKISYSKNHFRGTSYDDGPLLYGSWKRYPCRRGPRLRPLGGYHAFPVHGIQTSIG